MKKVWIVLTALCLMATAVLGVAAVSAAEIVYGDADGNGKINNRDLGLLQKYLNDDDVTIDTVAMDVDGNGKINNRDLGMLQKYLNDDDVTLGPDEPVEDDNIFNDTELDWS
ncbi:MAG: dockerin type I repeat-containing protein [Clostridia bacterium]|nr:dockerin type I repeat-containing protein [Clostridia bacterium]